MAIFDIFSKKPDQPESDDLSTELGRKRETEQKGNTSADNDPSVMPEWVQKQLNDATKKIRIAEKAAEEAKKKAQELQNKLNSAKDDTERKVASVRKELTVQIDYQKERAAKAEKESREVSDKLRSEFNRSILKVQQQVQSEYDRIDRNYRSNLNAKLNENMDLRRKIDALNARLDASVSGQGSVNEIIAQKVQEERLLLKQWAESEKQKALSEADKMVSEALSGKQDEKKIFKSYPDASSFSALALQYIGIIDSILSELDNEISEHYQDSDDANYFYVRRRLKYLQSIGDQNLVRYWDNDLDLLANHGVVLIGSELDKAIGDDGTRIVEILRYYLYNAVIHKTAGPALILAREMIAMPIYAGVESVFNLDKILALEKQLVNTINDLGYEIVDVELFKPLGTSTEVICVEQNDIELEGVLSGQVYEIVKLAVNFDAYREKTEVKVKL